MTDPSTLERQFLAGKFDSFLKELYGNCPDMLSRQRGRYCGTLRAFEARYGGSRSVSIYSVPGRAELCGNHTDHNNGLVAAAVVELDIIAAVAQSQDDRIRLFSRDFEQEFHIAIDELAPSPAEIGTSAAMVRGVAAGMKGLGAQLGGFDACPSSDIPAGSGLSSSAAFEVCSAAIINGEFNGGRVSITDMAIVSQKAENTYFGKPCGLMDQLACAFGGIITIDFMDPARPKVTPADFDPADYGYAFVVVDTGGSHAGLTSLYSAIRDEMERVARCFEKTSLREVERSSLLANISDMRPQVGDRAVLRALHFFGECERVEKLAMACGGIDEFLSIINESGRSSLEYNQNAYCQSTPDEQGIPLALAMSQTLLTSGAWRLQGGGFAGTIQAYVPQDKLTGYCQAMQAVFGSGSCRALGLRKKGPLRLAC